MASPEARDPLLDEALVDASFQKRAQTVGLGIDNVESHRQVSFQPDPLLPAHTNTAAQKEIDGVEDSGNERRPFGHSWSSTPLFPIFGADAEHERLQEGTASSTFLLSEPESPDFACESKHRMLHGRGNWFSVMILFLAVYSTIFSGIWLVLAIVKPRYGRRISTTGGTAPATASILFAAFAKSIELSFATVFVAFLGQALSRKAIERSSRGITIAEMSMRAWVLQPGIILTHLGFVRRAALTLLGFTALLAAVMAMLYTTASNALVAPQLTYSKAEFKTIYGRVATQFANPDYIKTHCKTPISRQTDPDYYGNTCVEIEHAGQAYHNYLQYLALWTKHIAEGNGSSSLALRPNAVGLFYENTTIEGSWINVENMTELSDTHGGRIINNITMAMPHVGVFAAARDPLNQIMQPEDLNDLGEYDIRASVPSPAVNILCASMTEDELAPMVYTKWPVSNGNPPNISLWPNLPEIPTPPSWLNATSVDDIFGFGEKYGRRSPIFPKYPLPYNTILNTTKLYVDSIYLLATSASSSYMLCSIRQSMTPNCSTSYHASQSGGNMRSHCEDPKDYLSYSKSNPAATNGVFTKDWINVAVDWAFSLALNAGVSDGDSSNARLLTQMIPTSPALDPSMPSIAEALAVLAGCTLLISSIDAPFIHYWNYSTTVPTLAEPQYQAFNATICSQDYASGGTQSWQSVFLVVLIFVFVTNCVCLAYFLLRGGLVTDFLEPENLFSLSINSPSSKGLEGSCGGGPVGDQLNKNWHIKCNDRGHVYIQEGNRRSSSGTFNQWRKGRRRRTRTEHGEVEMQQQQELKSPIVSDYETLAAKRTSLL